MGSFWEHRPNFLSGEGGDLARFSYSVEDSDMLVAPLL